MEPSKKSKIDRENDIDKNDQRIKIKSSLDIHHKNLASSFTATNNNISSEDYSRALNASQKISSIIPPPPLLIRPTPITQSRESILLNTEAKFWNQGNYVFLRFY